MQLSECINHLMTVAQHKVVQELSNAVGPNLMSHL